MKFGSLLMVMALLVLACGSDDDDAGDDTTTTATAAPTSADLEVTETTAAPTTAPAPDMEGTNVGMVFDIGGRGDMSFNDAAAAGMDRAVDSLGVEVTELEPAAGGENREELLRLLADQEVPLIFGVGFLFGDSIAAASEVYPDTSFAIVDSVVDAPNVASLVFAEEQGSFLVGAAAALKSESKKVGFIGGVGTDLIGKFEAGFEAGVKAVDPGVEVIVNYISQPPDFSGFTDPARGNEIGTAMYEQGADVVYHAAGGSGGGLFEAARTFSENSGSHVWAIGVDSDQYLTVDESLQPHVLTSMLKRVDVAVFETIADFVSGSFGGGAPVVFDLSVDGVGYSTTGGFVDDIVPTLEDYKARIVSGEIQVPSIPGEATTITETPSGEGTNVGMVFDIGGRGDMSFNDAAAAGMDRAVDSLGVEVTELEPAAGGENREELLRLLADQEVPLIFGVGFLFGDSIAAASEVYPDTSFAIVDSVVDAPNVASLVFAEEQGSFLVGAAAALKSESKKVGFIGGVGTDLIGKFEAGFEAGVKAVDPGVEVIVNYISQPPDFSGFTDPARGNEIGTAMYEQGADVVYHAAGGSGGGLFEAARTFSENSGSHVWAIGVDSDQYLTVDESLQPHVLTSMLKRVDVAVFETIADFVSGSFGGGAPVVFDLSVDGVGYSTTGGFVDDIVPTLEDYKARIVSGEIQVPSVP